MLSCKEFQLDDLTAITAIPVTKIGTASADSPVLALTPVLSYDFSTAFDASTIVIGQTKAVTSVGGVPTPVGTLVPIVRMSGKAKDAESDGVAGRSHTVTVTCEADDRDSSVLADLLALERTPSHLLLTFRGGQQAFVSATRDTYICETERSGAKVSVSFKVHNLMGIQMLA